MTPEDSYPRRWFYSLRLRLAVMLSLALLPIGLIAVLQTKSVSDKARENAELALLVLTETAALNERLLIQRAIGSATLLASRMPDLMDDPLLCERVFKRFVTQEEQFSFAGFIPVSGKMQCSSAGQNVDFTGDNFKATVAGGTRRVQVNLQGVISETSVVVVSEPVYQNDTLLGFISISIPHSSIDAAASKIDEDALIDIITFNRDGALLTSRAGLEHASGRLPDDINLADFSRWTSTSFSQESEGGQDLIYTVVPIEGGQIFVMGVWDAERGLAQSSYSALGPSVFPLLMWLISLAVALYTVHRLVSRHLKLMGRQMSRFARDRHLPSEAATREMPTELRIIQDSFASMAESILKDEAAIEDAMRQKSILMKEIHHRVKNNLQLISSILNMQIREARHEDTKMILRRMQDRVLSLATIHRDLYQSSNAGLVDVGALVSEIVDKSAEIGPGRKMEIRFETDIGEVLLYPDQAVPMSLLAAEASANALKYIGNTNGSDSWITIQFHCAEDKTCRFVIENSVGVRPEVESTGMGSRLIAAFAVQLGAKVEQSEEDGVFKMSVEFKAEEFAPETVDY
ncbi:MAG: sensor histidine kinase [Sulfitobacter sp.]